MRKRPQLVTTISRVQSLVLYFLIVGSLFDVCAQSASTGALTGTVADADGAIVQNAKIIFRNYSTNNTLTAVTDQDGLYRFSLLPPGDYELTVDAAGFAPLVVRHVIIQISEVRRIPIKLAVRGVTESIEVKSPLLQTENATLGRVIPQETIVALPLVNRNYTQILG